MVNKSIIDQVRNMKMQGLTNNQIIQNLQQMRVNNQEIFDAINQVDIKNASPYNSEYQPSALNINPDNSNEEMLPEAPSAPEAPEQTEYQEPYSDYQEYPQEYYPQNYYPQQLSKNTGEEELELLAEKIISEKWKTLTKSTGNLNTWKKEIDFDIVTIKRDIENISNQIKTLQEAIAGKVQEYNQNLTSIETQMKSMEMVFEKIIPPLTSNVKQLSTITEKLKNNKKTNS